jgi:hypothetical protein
MAHTFLTHDDTIALTAIFASDCGMNFNHDQRQSAGTITFAACFSPSGLPET